MFNQKQPALSPTEPPIPASLAAFPATRWSRVRAAGHSEAEGQDAFANLCADYWPPVFAYLRQRGFSEADAQDVTQGFFLHLLEHRSTRRADASLGKFRSFLLGALRNYLANEKESRGRQKRGGGREIFSLDDPAHAFAEPSCESTADRYYEQSWAQEVMHRALTRLREKFASENRADLFNGLEGFLDVTGEGSALEEAAAALHLSAGALRTAVSRLRKQFGEQVRLEIARTVSAPHEIEEEFQCLRAALSARS
ncbi:MAG: sigma-70 family RNA polymerase sigma factor [Verrucomicrobiota bacterium]|nr:sigma-70 family RNA polymerase sigma factor [Verrucomicrobiota bacterium]